MWNILLHYPITHFNFVFVLEYIMMFTITKFQRGILSTVQSSSYQTQPVVKVLIPPFILFNQLSRYFNFNLKDLITGAVRFGQQVEPLLFSPVHPCRGRNKVNFKIYILSKSNSELSLAAHK